MRLILPLLALLLPAGDSLAQGYPTQEINGRIYRQVDRGTLIGSDGRVYIRRGNTLIVAEDPALRAHALSLPAGSRAVGKLGDSTMIETADGQRQICTPVGGQTICH